MKNLVIKMGIVLLLVIGLLMLFYSTDDFNELEEKENTATREVKPVNPVLTEGAGSYIGKDIDDWTETYGYPERIYAADNKYQHYIYRLADAFYDVRVRERQIGMIYATGVEADIAPLSVNQRAAEIYQGTSINTEPVIRTADGDYHLELSEADMKTQLLIRYGKVYMQVYIDRLSGRVMAARFMTPDMLVQMQPYTAHLNGRPLERTIKKVRPLLQQLNEQETLTAVINMMRANYEVHNLTAAASVKPLCQSQGAALSSGNGYDAAEVVNDWLNSSDRDMMLNSQYDRIQTAVKGCYAVRYLNE